MPSCCIQLTQIPQYFQVGGFLGLLLGASVLTVIELLDFIILKCLHRMAVKKEAEEEKPGTEILKWRFGVKYNGLCFFYYTSGSPSNADFV